MNNRTIEKSSSVPFFHRFCAFNNEASTPFFFHSCFFNIYLLLISKYSYPFLSSVMRLDNCWNKLKAKESALFCCNGGKEGLNYHLLHTWVGWELVGTQRKGCCLALICSTCWMWFFDCCINCRYDINNFITQKAQNMFALIQWMDYFWYNSYIFYSSKFFDIKLNHVHYV